MIDRHITNEFGDCVHWCRRCLKEKHAAEKVSMNSAEDEILQELERQVNVKESYEAQELVIDGVQIWPPIVTVVTTEAMNDDVPEFLKRLEEFEIQSRKTSIRIK